MKAREQDVGKKGCERDRGGGICTYSGPPKRYFLFVEAVSMVMLVFYVV